MSKISIEQRQLVWLTAFAQASVKFKSDPYSSDDARQDNAKDLADRAVQDLEQLQPDFASDVKQNETMPPDMVYLHRTKEDNDIDLMIDMVDLIRSIMYSSDEGSHNWFDEVEDLAKTLGKYDEVPYSAKDNRLIQLMEQFRQMMPRTYIACESLNDPK